MLSGLSQSQGQQQLGQWLIEEQVALKYIDRLALAD
jgi:hypothetical protein